MSTAFEKIGTDRQLQDHWVRRLIAGIIDFIILYAIGWILTFPFRFAVPTMQAWVFDWWALPSFISGILFLLYASFMESIQGSTIGKQIMNLKVTTTDGRIPTLGLSLVRNVSKIYVLLWLLDVIVGMATVGDPHQKYSDRIAGTTEVSTITRGMIVPTPAGPQVPTPPST